MTVTRTQPTAVLAYAAASDVQDAHEAEDLVDADQFVAAMPSKGATRRLDELGPLPDDAPMQGVAIHVEAKQVAPALVAALHRKLGDKLEVSGHGFLSPQAGYDLSCVWLRDFMPQTVRQASGELRMVSTLSINPLRSGFVGSTYIPIAPPKPGQQFFRPAGRTTGGAWQDVVELPLLHENGNLVRVSELSIVTDKLLSDNAEPHHERHLRTYQARDATTVRKLFCDALQIPPSRLVVLPRLPGEKTGHVDLFVMSVGGQALVPEIRPEALAVLGYAHEQALGEKVRDALDQAAATLAKHGAQVVRLPMMPPVDLQPAPTPEGWHGVFFSPANSLLANVDGKKHAFVPTHEVPPGYPAAYRQMSDGYAAEWKSFFTSRGFDTELVPANELAHAYGLFRCLTRPIA